MTQTVIGAFDTFREAEQAEEALIDAGFTRSQIQVKANPNSPATAAGSPVAGELSTPPEHEGVMASIRDFFRDLFGEQNHPVEASHYAEAVRRGGALVSVDVEDEARVEIAHQTLVSAGAVDIDERAAQWASTGGYTPRSYETGTAGAYSGDPFGSTGEADLTGATTGASAIGAAPLNTGTTMDPLATRRASGMGDYSTPATAGTVGRDDTSSTEKVLPVVREEMEVGKRQVNTGGVRVFSRMTERPVSEEVRLREEHARVERRSVDRPATAADLEGVTGGSVEVRETAERAVVNKTAHVIEEVVVGKEVSERTETVSDTLRDTEVEVERLAGTGETSGDFSRYDPAFRADYQSRYAAEGGAYDDYMPAYRHGYTLANDERYRGRDWDAIEPDARRDWETRNPGSSWERFKMAVRHGWEHVTGRR